jgi:hypothetical protein
MSCDVNQLLDDAKCIQTCIPAGMMGAVSLAALCNISGGGGSMLVSGAVANNAPETQNPIPVAGLAVTAATYNPGYTAGDRASIAIDAAGGGILVNQRALALATDFASVGGDIANDAVDSGSPVKIGGRAQNDLAQAVVSNGDRVDACFDTTGRQWVKIGGKDPVNLLNSSARTTTQTSAAQTFLHARGVTLWLNITAYTAGGLTVSVQCQDVNTGNYATLATFTKAQATGIFMYQIYPGIATVAGTFANALISRVFRVVVTVDDATSITYSVGMEVEP